MDIECFAYHNQLAERGIQIFERVYHVYHLVFHCNKFNSESSGPSAHKFCPSGAPFGPVHFTEYTLKLEYKEFTPENILEQDPLARLNLQVRYNRQGPWHHTKSCLFKDKYNLLPVYQLDIEPPITLKPMPVSTPELPLDHTNKLFGIVYSTLSCNTPKQWVPLTAVMIGYMFINQQKALLWTLYLLKLPAK
ncbi:hypothetical protein DSO57_1022007 [Entomophthora muscae]|uniref:Uncharacterized protein n=1 Tax=Entomophthora muscae TaxID=34485 RepID=A0ACC2SSC4_9FUNG|nr:hypothetical protein DSO57_1022007 [Entomophthora muscae]